MATTDDLVLLDRAVSNHLKAELRNDRSSFSRELSDGDCGFWRFNRYTPRGRLQLASSQRANWIRRLPDHYHSWLLTPEADRSVMLSIELAVCTLIISPLPSGLRSLP